MKAKLKTILQNGAIFIMICIIINEFYNTYVDWYNFWQLEKVKIIMTTKQKKTQNFNNLQEFNKIYDTNITSIKNCYDITNYNWKEKYWFWFQLESHFYKLLYKNKYFYYPSYDVEPAFVCTWHCYDSNRSYFEYTVSHPCREDNK